MSLFTVPFSCKWAMISYVESSWFVVSSTVERNCCGDYRSKSLFDAVWVIDLHPNGYLDDIWEKFDTYYWSLRNYFHISFSKYWSTSILSLIYKYHFKMVLKSVVMYIQTISFIYNGLVHILMGFFQHYFELALRSLSFIC